jgi:hypothetical protein
MNILYIPILKAKEGEFGALAELDPEVGPQITPLLEIPGIPYDYLNDRPSRTIDAHVRGVVERLVTSWGSGRPVYVDYSAHAREENSVDNSQAFATVLAEAKDADVQVLPVVYTWNSDESVSVASSHAQATGHGACIRLTVADFDEEVDLEERIDHLLRRLELKDSEVDVLLDLREIQSDVQRAILLVRAMLAGLPRAIAWRRLIVAASSFPEDLRDVGAASIKTLPRREWELWSALCRRPERLPRKDIIFSDYGISHPSHKEVDPRTMTMSASIRYTARNEWVIVKGRGLRQYGFEQYHDLCEQLVRHSAYEGRQFSWADGYIAETAERKSGPGNATTWRKVGTNHHITLVALQLSNQLGS